MNRKSRDWTGVKIGRLTALRKESPGKWLCKCSCGNELSVRSYNLYGNHTRSCGCLQIDRVSSASKKHGLCKSRAYRIWANMKARCDNPQNPAYKWYGARGIAYQKSWSNFENFYADMGEPPPKMTLERKNNDRGYGKNNCYWATRTQQANNTRQTVTVEYNGLKMSLSQWARHLGWNQGKLDRRLRRGWAIKEAITTP